MRGSIGDKVRLTHILDAIIEIEEYVVDANYSKFKENSMMRFACIKQLEVIGEASNHITTDIKEKFSSIKWPQIIGIRHIFVHEYFGIDSKLVWDIIKNDLTILKVDIQNILISIQ